MKSMSRCTVGSDARVPQDTRDLPEVEARMGIADEYRAAIEQEAHGGAPSNEHAGENGVGVPPVMPSAGFWSRDATTRNRAFRTRRQQNLQQLAVVDASRAKN
jgi:hypothetical protein